MAVSKPMWAVCLYVEGGEWDGECVMKFVNASDRDFAIAHALNLCEDLNADGFQVNEAAQVPMVVT